MMIAASGRACLESLTRSELSSLRHGQKAFFGALFLPIIVSHVSVFFGCERPRFPATISWTTRRGLPFYCFAVCWLVGWFEMHQACKRCPGGTSFIVQMVMLGIVALFLAPIGVSRFQDIVHHVASLFYMVDHVVLIVYLQMRPLYGVSFCIAFLGFLAATFAVKKSKIFWKLNTQPPPADVMPHIDRLPPLGRRRILRLLFLEMLFEYLLFFAFISGISSGIS